MNNKYGYTLYHFNVNVDFNVKCPFPRLRGILSGGTNFLCSGKTISVLLCMVQCFSTFKMLYVNLECTNRLGKNFFSRRLRPNQCWAKSLSSKTNLKKINKMSNSLVPDCFLILDNLYLQVIIISVK